MLPWQGCGTGSSPALIPLFTMPLACAAGRLRHGCCPLPTAGASLHPGDSQPQGTRPIGRQEQGHIPLLQELERETQDVPGWLRWELGSGGSPAPTPSWGCCWGHPIQARLGGARGYFGSFQHHPERCPMLLFIAPLAPAQLQPLACRNKPGGAKTNGASSIPAPQETTATGPRMLLLPRPAPGCPSGWTSLGTTGPGAGLSQHKAARPPGWTSMCWGCCGVGGEGADRSPSTDPSTEAAAICQEPACVTCPARGLQNHSG